MKKNTPPSLEDSIIFLLKKAKNQPVTMKFLFETLSGKGRYLILLLLSLPFCQPIPLPGLSTIFGLVIVLIGISIIVGKHVMLPKAFLKRKVSHKAIEKIAKTALWLVKKIKPLLHRRLELFIFQPAFRILNGVIIALLGFFLAIPLPIPLTNLIPGWIIFMMSLGLLEDDGLIMVIAYTVLSSVVLLVLYLIIFPMMRAVPYP